MVHAAANQGAPSLGQSRVMDCSKAQAVGKVADHERAAAGVLRRVKRGCLLQNLHTSRHLMAVDRTLPQLKAISSSGESASEAASLFLSLFTS